MDAEKLCYSIETRSPLYNIHDRFHGNRIVSEKLWSEVAAEMGSTVFECKNKWSNLRNCYSRYLREERTKPAGLGAKQKKKWYLADAMSFLKDFVNQHHRDSLEDNVTVEVSREPSLNESIDGSAHVPAKRSRSAEPDMAWNEYLQSQAKDELPESSNLLFLKSLIPDLNQLSSKRQRVFKMNVLGKLNELLEEEEKEAAQAFKISPKLENVWY